MFIVGSPCSCQQQGVHLNHTQRTQTWHVPLEGISSRPTNTLTACRLRAVLLNPSRRPPGASICTVTMPSSPVSRERS